MDVGDVAIITATFLVEGVPTDPDTVEVTISPSGGEGYTLTYANDQIQRRSVGVYVALAPCTSDGVWEYRWISTGTAPAAAQGFYHVIR